MQNVTLRSQERGLTLVELAIVIVIIGILLAGILKGQELIENARLKSTVSQIQSFEAAFNTFQDTFNGLPGDFVRADTRLANCADGNDCQNGDGNGIIGDAGALGGADEAVADETVQAWTHLVLADLISGLSLEEEADIAWGVTHPTAAIGGGYLVGHGNGGDGSDRGITGHGLALQGQPDDTAANATGVLTASRAFEIDQKMDDGSPDSGAVRGVNSGSAGDTADCETDYTVGDDNLACNILVRVLN